MNPSPPDIDTTRIEAEPMVDGRQAATALRLPYYWFSDQAMRVRHRIPHYLLGGLVRYRMSELLVWAQRNNQHPSNQHTPAEDA